MFNCSAIIFKTLRLCNRWAYVDEIVHIWVGGRGTKLLGSGILNFGYCAARGLPNLARSLMGSWNFKVLILWDYAQANETGQALSTAKGLQLQASVHTGEMMTHPEQCDFLYCWAQCKTPFYEVNSRCLQFSLSKYNLTMQQGTMLQERQQRLFNCHLSRTNHVSRNQNSQLH